MSLNLHTAIQISISTIYSPRSISALDIGEKEKSKCGYDATFEIV